MISQNLELHFVEPCCKRGVAFRLAHVDGPPLRMVFGDVFGAVGVADGREIPGFGTDDYEVRKAFAGSVCGQAYLYSGLHACSTRR